MKTLVLVILAFATAGLAFSGHLSYRELFANAPAECTPIGAPGTILGVPPCIYGFFMYLVIAGLTLLALMRRRHAS